MGERIDVEFANFYCCIEWHLARLGFISALIYPFALRISSKSRKFNCSAQSVAEFFGVSVRTVQRGYEQLRIVGFFKLLESGKPAFQSSVFRVLTHKEWAEEHPGGCVQKLAFAWSEGDPLGQQLWAVSGSQVKFTSVRINMLRRTGIPEPKIISLFEFWYPKYKATQKGRRWQRSASYHFVMYVRGLCS